MSADKPHIVSLDAFMPAVEQWLNDAFIVHRVWQNEHAATELHKLGEFALGIAALGSSVIDGPLLDRLPKAKIVSLGTVGFDAVDIVAAKTRNVAVTNTPDVLTDDVADLAIALLIATSRRLITGDRYVRAGRWITNGPLPLARTVSGKTAAILGLGRIGSGIARRAEACGLKVIYGGRTIKSNVPWPFVADPVELARQADFLVVAVPGGAATRHLVNRAVLDALGPEGIIVNIARGSVIDEKEMVDALLSKRLGGAGLDVFEDEPRAPVSLFALDNVVLQPHIGSSTTETRSKMGRLMIENLLAHFAGKPLLTPVT
jgi:hydroxypyruvate reductase